MVMVELSMYSSLGLYYKMAGALGGLLMAIYITKGLLSRSTGQQNEAIINGPHVVIKDFDNFENIIFGNIKKIANWYQSKTTSTPLTHSVIQNKLLLRFYIEIVQLQQFSGIWSGLEPLK